MEQLHSQIDEQQKRIDKIDTAEDQKVIENWTDYAETFLKWVDTFQNSIKTSEFWSVTLKAKYLDEVLRFLEWAVQGNDFIALSWKLNWQLERFTKSLTLKETDNITIWDQYNTLWQVVTWEFWVTFKDNPSLFFELVMALNAWRTRWNNPDLIYAWEEINIWTTLKKLAEFTNKQWYSNLYGLEQYRGDQKSGKLKDFLTNLKKEDTARQLKQKQEQM